MSNLDELQTQIDGLFRQAFGPTPLPERVRDLVRQAESLGECTDPACLREAAGELLCRLLQLCTECQWPAAELLAAALKKIREEHARKSAVASHHPACRKVAVFASTFDPPSLYHRTVVERLLKRGFDEVLVLPSGPRPGRNEREHALATHRAAMVDLAFGRMPCVCVDLSDLDEGRSTPPATLEQRYAQDAELWHVVSDQQVAGGADARSAIHQEWANGPELWRSLRFIILHAPDRPPAQGDLPPRHFLLAMEGHMASAELRNRVYNGQSISDWVPPEISEYIRRHDLFAPMLTPPPRRLQLQEIRLQIEYDAGNPAAAELARRYQPWVSDAPNLVLVIGGDGSMLHAIRAHWRKRVPIVGLNAGHLGFLANERLPLDLSTAELFTYPVPLMRVIAEASDGSLRRELAFGDAWVERDGGQAAWLRLDMNGETRVPKIVGDGMLVATASGSPAYARAMGAIPVPLTTPVMILAGSNIFRPRFWKPMTLADNMLLSLVNIDETGKRLLRGFVDGLPLGIVQSLTVRRSAIASVELAYTSQFDPSAKLLRSLFPPLEEGA